MPSRRSLRFLGRWCVSVESLEPTSVCQRGVTYCSDVLDVGCMWSPKVVLYVSLWLLVSRILLVILLVLSGSVTPGIVCRNPDVRTIVSTHVVSLEMSLFWTNSSMTETLAWTSCYVGIFDGCRQGGTDSISLLCVQVGFNFTVFQMDKYPGNSLSQ